MAVRLKKLISVLIYRLHLWPVILRLCGRFQRQPVLAVFTFHRILALPASDQYLQGYERGVSAADFDRQLTQILRLFRVVDVTTFAEIATRERPFSDHTPLALLTFDDADTSQLPVLERLADQGLPAVLFVATSFIESDHRFYHLRLTNICNQLDDSCWREIAASVPNPAVKTVIQEYLPNVRERRREFRRKLIAPFDALPPKQRDALLTQWESSLKTGYTLGIRCMDWSDIKRLASRGITVGSHTVNHNQLALLDRADQEFELRESRQGLERALGLRVATICYPQGSFDENTAELCQEAGYEFGFTSNKGLVDCPLIGQRKYLVPRVDLDCGPDHQIAWSIGSIALKQYLRAKGHTQPRTNRQ
jgi:peptidoglycan/xylan/chitin deacetylase (PgdA/CDA1 family)